MRQKIVNLNFGYMRRFYYIFTCLQPTYEVVHYPHVDHHLDYHHLDVIPAPVVPTPVVAPAPAIHYGHPVYAGRALDEAQKMAYSAYLN